jgi:DNA processing protein
MRSDDFKETSTRSGGENFEIYALALMSCPHIGTARLTRALDKFGGPRGAFEAMREGEASFLSLGRDRVRRAQAEAVARYLQQFDFDGASEMLARLGARVLSKGTPGYPSQLADGPFAPPFLLAAGSTEFLAYPSIAIVGTRRATVTGIEVARRLAHELAASGLGVVSGLAKGIDAAAHSGSLEVSGNPSAGGSVAILGCGLDVVYPPQNQSLYRQLLEKGTIVSQYGLGAPPERWRFPERNRTVAGVARAVVVVESFSSGGALSTVAAANDLGREVLAVPGSVLNAAAEGTNQLIWEGAVPVRSAADVIEYLSLDKEPQVSSTLWRNQQDSSSRRRGSAPETSSVLTDAQHELISLLGDGEPRTLSELAAYSRASPASVIDDLVELTRLGFVAPCGQERFVARGARRVGSGSPY